MSSDEIFFDGIKYVSAVSAAQESNLTRDYIARLCREGRIHGKRIGKQWYVEHPSLQSFRLEHRYELERQRNALAELRSREYRTGVNNTRPSHENPLSPLKETSVQNTLPEKPVNNFGKDILMGKPRTVVRDQIARALASNGATVPIGLGDAALRLASHAPVALVSQPIELLHKITALLVAVSLTLGTYAMVDTKFATFAKETMRSTALSLSNPSHIISLGTHAKNQLAAAALDPAGTFFAAMSGLARSLNSSVDRFVYAVAFPDSLTRNRDPLTGGTVFTDAGSRATVAVSIEPYTSGNESTPALAPSQSTSSSNLAQADTGASAPPTTTIINNPVVERILQTELVVAMGGISEDILNRKLQQLDNKLSSQMFSISAANSTVTAQNYTVTAQTNKIDQLNSVAISNATITGGSISGASVSATSVSTGDLSAGNTTLASTTVTGNLSVGGSLNLSGASGSITAANATITNATTTNFYSVLGHFTTGVIDTLSGALATITSLTATELVATNATTTNATSTALYVSGLAQLTSLGAGTSTITNLAVTNTSTSTFAGGFTIANSGFVYQQATGRIGIGTTSPASIFDIYGTDALRLPVGSTVQRPSQAGIGQVRYNVTTHQFEGYGDNSVWQGLGGVIDADQDTYITADTNNTDEDTLRLITFGTERMTLTPAGNVGVGTTSPFAKFAIHAKSGETNSLLFEIASSTASATTSLFKVNNKGDGYFFGGLGVGVATTSAGVLQTSGNAWFGGNLYVAGDSTTIGTSNTNALIINSSIQSNIVPNQNATYDLGSTAYYWKNVYVGTLTANNISAASTTIGGTQSSTFTLNSDNTTADTEDMSLIFYRGTVVPNAILAWNSTLDRFEFNQSAYISNQSGSTTQPTLSLKGVSGQTGNLFEVASSTGTTVFSVAYDGSVTIGNAVQTGTLTQTGLATFQNGFLGNASSTITSGLFSMNGGASTTNITASGTGYFTTATTTNLFASSATSTNLFSTTASSTNLFSQTATFGTITTPGSLSSGTTSITNLAVTNTSTSTFAGGLTIAGSGFVYQQATGRIGIGTTSPASIFDIYGTDALRLPVGSTAQRPGQAGIGQVRYNVTTHQFEGYGDNSVWQGLGGVIDADQDTYITADTNNQDEDTLRLITFGTERMTLTPAGNVGVGTTSPFAKFAIHAKSGETNSLLFEIASSTASATTSLFSISNAGLTTLLNLSMTAGTTTNLFSTTASSTNLYSTNFNLGAGTLGNATTTNLFSTTASSTNLYSMLAYLGTVTLNSETVSGLSTFASGFVSQASSTVAGDFTTTGTNTFGGNLTVSGSLTNLQRASTTILSSYGPAYFGASATSSFSNAGVLTLASALAIASGGTATTTQVTNGVNYFDGTRITSGTALTYDGTKFTAPFASSTALSVSGTGYFGTASSTNLTVSSLTLNRVPYITTAGAFTDSANLTFDGTTLTAANLTSSGNVSLGNATTTNLFSTTASSTNLFSQSATLGALTVSGNTTHTGTLAQTGLATFTNGFLSNASSTITSGLFTMSGGASTTNLTASGTGYFGSLGGASVSSLTANYLSKWNSGTFANSLLYDTGTNVGIGTTSPQAKLEVYDTSAASTTPLYVTNFSSGTSSAKVSLAFRTQDATNGAGTSTASIGSILQQNFAGGKGDLAFSTLRSGSLTEAMRILDTGNVGIGTTTPGSILSVQNVGNFVASATSTLYYGLQAATLNITGASTLANTIISSATSTNLFSTTASSTNLYSQAASVGTLAASGATTLSSTLNVTGLTTLGNLSLTAGTTTNFFSTTASSTNLFSQSATIGTLTVNSTLTQTGLATFTNGFISNASSTITSGLFSMNGGASTTNLTASGTGYFGSLGGASVSSLTANYLSKWNSGTFANSLLFDTGTNVGIGTTTPSAKLEVTNTSSGATADQLYLTNLASATSTAARLSFRTQDIINNTGTSTASITGILQQNFNTGKGDLAFSTLRSGTLTEAMRILDTGNVGIGTTTPGSILSIQNVGNFVASATSTLYYGLQVPTFNATGLSTLANTLITNATTTNLFSTTASSTNLYSTNFNLGVGTLGNATTTNLFSTTASSTNLFSQSATIGTLTVNSTLTQTGLATFTNGFISNASSTITSGVFSMNGGASTTNITASGIGYFGSGRFTDTTGTSTIATGQGFTVGSSQLVVQQGSGNVGVGTTSPSANLVVNGTTGQNLFQIATSTSQNILIVNQNGLVGIGTTTPGSVLSIQNVGNFVASATSTLYNGLSAATLNITGASTLANTTITNATTTNLFSTTASSTNLYAQAAALGTLTASGATTLSSTLNVSGLTTLGQASTTLFSSYGPAYFGASATSSFSNAGVLTLTGITNSLLAVNASGVVGATTTPTAQYFIATSTTATSTFAGGLTVGTNKFVVNNFSSNIGIGTTSPSVALDIASAKTGINIWAATTSGYRKANIGYSDAVATDVFTISTAANVGGSYQDIQILPNGATGNTGLYLNTSGQTGLGYTSFGDTSIGNALLVNGRIGVGTTTPTNALAVVVNGRATGDLRYGLQIVNTDSANTKATNIALLGGGGSGASSGNWFIGTDAVHDNSSNFFIATSTGANAYKQFVFNSEGSLQIGQVSSAPSVTTDKLYNLSGGIYWNGTNLTGGVTNYWAHSGSYTYVSTATDTIGIGTSSPYAKLSISANSGDTNTTLFVIASSTPSATTTLFSISNTGALSAGTSTLTNLIVSNTSTSTFAGYIDVNGTSGTSTIASNLWVKGTLRTGTGSLYLNDTSLAAANGGFALNTSATSTFATNGFTIGTSQLVVQQTSGNVGVGTTSPSTTLGVVGHCVTGDTRLRRRRKRRTWNSELGIWDDILDPDSPSSISSFDDEYVYNEVAIKDIKEGDEIQSLDEKTGKLVWSRVNALLDMGVKTTYRLKTADGREIRTTAEHPYLVKNAKGKWLKHDSPIEGAGWVAVSQLREGDLIAVAGSVTGLPLLNLRDDNNVSVPKPHLDSVVADAHSVAVLRSTEFDDMSMLQGVGTLAQNGKLAFDSEPGLLGEARERSVCTWVLQDNEHGNYSARFADRFFVGSNGIHELSLSACSIRRSSFATSSGVESSKKSTKSSNVLLEIAEDGAMMPRIFLSLMMVIKDLFMTASIAPSLVKPQWSKSGELELKAPSFGPGVELLRTVYSRGGVLSSGTDGMVWIRVNSLEKVAEEQVYDIEVEGTHNFIGNDIVAHNTYLTGGLGVGVLNTTNGTLQTSGAATIGGALTVNGTGASTIAGPLALSSTTGTTTIASGQGFTVGSSQLVVQQGSGNVGIGTAGPGAKLDIAYGGYQSSLGALRIGADVGALTTRTDATRKFAVISVPHYTNAEESVIILSGDSDSTNSYVNIGGSVSGFNSPTIVRFFTAANTITTSGTERMSIDSAGLVTMAQNLVVSGTGNTTIAGNVGIGTTSPDQKLHVYGGTENAQFKITRDGNSGQYLTLGVSGASSLLNVVNTNTADYPEFNLQATNNTTSVSRLFISQAGNVGIGTVGPWDPLSVIGDISLTGGDLRLGTGSATTTLTTSATAFAISANATTTLGTTGLNIGSGQFVVEQTSGNVGIGTTGPGAKLDVKTSGETVARLTGDSQGGDNPFGSVEFYNTGSAALASKIQSIAGGLNHNQSALAFFTSAPTFGERMRIDVAGNVGIASTTPWRTLSVVGTVAFNGLTSSATGNAVCITTAKDITDAAAGTCTPSSIRFKENVSTLPSGSALSTLNQLRVVSFDYKNGYFSPEDGASSYGLIAEEVETVDPKLVDYDYDGLPQTLHFERLTGLSIQAVQELDAKLNLLAASSTIGEYVVNNYYSTSTTLSTGTTTPASSYELLASSFVSTSTLADTLASYSLRSDLGNYALRSDLDAATSSLFATLAAQGVTLTAATSSLSALTTNYELLTTNYSSSTSALFSVQSALSADISDIKNEIAALAGGDFLQASTDSSGAGTDSAIIANWSYSSSTPAGLVDILKPPAGIEPAMLGLSVPASDLLGGYLLIYHNLSASSFIATSSVWTPYLSVGERAEMRALALGDGGLTFGDGSYLTSASGLVSTTTLADYVGTSDVQNYVTDIVSPLGLTMSQYASDLASATSSLAELLSASSSYATNAALANYATFAHVTDIVSPLGLTMSQYASGLAEATSSLFSSLAAQGVTLQSQGDTLAALFSASSSFVSTTTLASALSNIPSAALTGTMTGDIIPDTDNAYSLGSPTNKFSHVYAQNLIAGDLGFSETTSAVSGNALTAGSVVALYISATGGSCSAGQNSTCTVPIDFRTAINTTSYGANSVYFNTSGGLGLGIASTTALRGKLDVEAAIASGDARYLTLANTSSANGNAALTYSMYIPSSTGDLNFASNDNNGALVNDSYSAWNLKLGGQTDAFSISRSPTGTLSYANLFNIRNNGNVGIGTSSPYAMLSVAGQVVGTYFTATSTTLANTFPYASSTALTVSGTSYLTGITSTGNTTLGNATTTNLFSTTASSTNLYAQAASVGTLAASGATTLSSTLGVTGLSTLAGFLSTASSTITSGLFTMSGGASTTNLTASGTGYFGLGQFTNTSGTTTIASGQGFTVGSSQLVVQQGSGNVGIGTTAPARKLEVRIANPGTTLGSNEYIWLSDTTGTTNTLHQIGFGYSGGGATTPGALISGQAADNSGYNNNLLFATRGSSDNTAPTERMRITSAGNVGIGTTATYGRLSVANTTGLTNFMNLWATDANANGTISGITFTTMSTQNRPRAAIWANSVTFDAVAAQGAELHFGTYGAADGTAITTSNSRMMIDVSGNVGIGTTVPTQLLTLASGGIMSWIDASTAAEVTQKIQTSAITDAGVYNRISDGIQVVTGTISAASGYSGALALTTGNATQSDSFNNSQRTGSITLTTGNMTGSSGGGETGGSGNITLRTGSLTTYPSGTAGYVSFETGLVERMRITSAGNVGIGTTSPSTTLVLGGTTAVPFIIDSTNAQSNLQFRTSGTSRGYIGYSSLAASAITFTSAAGNVANMVIQDAGNVGIGTTGPGAKLDVKVATAIPQIKLTAFEGSTGSRGILFTDSSDSEKAVIGPDSTDTQNLRVQTTAALTFHTGGNLANVSPTGERMRITSGGNVGIGTTTPTTQKLVIDGSVDADTSGISLNTSVGPHSWWVSAGWRNVNANSFAIKDQTAGAYRFAIDGSGNVTPGADNSQTLGSSSLHWDCVYYDATVTGTCASDARLKGNIADFSLGDNALAQVAGLRPRTFTYNDNPAQTTNYGFIAQEVQAVAPELVTTEENGYLAVRYGYLPYLTIEAIQQLDTRTNFISNSATSTALFVDVAGNVGIGTTTPQHRLQVAGDVAAEAFVNSSTRDLKTDITSVATTTEDSILEQLATTNVYSYRYKDEPATNPLRVGLIVDSAPTEVLSVNNDGVDIYKLAVFTLAGVKAQERKIAAIDERVGVLEQAIAELKAAALATSEALAQAGTSLAADGASAVGIALASVLDGLKLLGVDIAQNLAHFVKVVADNFQVGSAEHPTGITMYDKTTGEPYCFQIDNGSATTTAGACTDIIIPVASQTASAAGAGGDTSQGGVTSGAVPTMSINGNNPANLNVGDTFGDLGAIITGPTEADKNLGIHTFLDGVAMDTINLDTSIAGEHTIDYVATNSFGTATSTRTVIVEAPAGQVVTDTTSTPPNTVATSTDVVASSATTTPTTP